MERGRNGQRRHLALTFLLAVVGCGETPEAPTTAPSCAAPSDSECSGGSCCSHVRVPGGAFAQGRGTEACASCVEGCPAEVADYCEVQEQPEHTATLSDFTLDKHEVTVGRFRVFVEAGGGTQLSPPDVDSGAHPSLPGSGWNAEWNAMLAPDNEALRASLRCVDDLHTWTDVAASNETHAINCVSWYTAFAFCIWDGGRLPTEAEWEYAAAGGDDNRVYPWGADLSSPNPANYSATNDSPFVPVGSYALGNGRWGHADLSGSMWEWTLDGYALDAYRDVQSGCDDCIHPPTATERVIRGGNWYSSSGTLRATYRFGRPPEFNRIGIGVRCAGR